MVRRTLLVAVAAFSAFSSHALAAPEKARPTIAVLFFDYGGKDPALEPLREGLAQMLISDLTDATKLQVVERARLKAILDEQKLGRSGKVDPGSAARIGKLLGARYLVLGSYFDLGATLRLDARVVEVETGKIVKGVGATGLAADFWAIEQDLAGKLEGVLASALPDAPSGAKPRDARPPKVKTTTIATYGRALALIDDGHKSDAKDLLTKVVTEAPGFVLAKADLNALLR